MHLFVECAERHDVRNLLKIMYLCRADYYQIVPNGLIFSAFLSERSSPVSVRKAPDAPAESTEKMIVHQITNKTISANKATVTKEWVIVDAEGQTLGRMCAKVAKLLRGKYKPNFTPHVDCGDNVIVINADKIVLSGNKWDGRIYLRHTGYPGGQRQFTPRDLMNKGPEYLFRKVVKGMLPKNRLGAKIIGNLYVYAGTEHKHEAQQPRQLDINSLK